MANASLWNANKPITVGGAGTKTVTAGGVDDDVFMRCSTSAQARAYVQVPMGYQANGDNVTDGTAEYVTARFRVSALPSIDIPILKYGNPTSADFRSSVVLKTTGAIVGRNDSGTESSSAGTIALDTWFEVRFRWASGGNIEVKLDSGSVVTVAATAATSVNVVNAGIVNTDAEGNSTYTVDVGSVVVGSAWAPANYRVYCCKPDGNGGDASGWSGGTGSGFGDVDDYPSDDDTTYWQAINGTNKRSVTLGAMPAGHTPLSIQAHARVREVTSATSSFQVYIDDGTEAASSSFNAGTSYTGSQITTIRDTLPSGGALTESAVNALEVGVIHAAINVATNPRCTQLGLLVLLEPIVSTGTGATTAAAQSTSAAGGVTVKGTAATVAAAQVLSAAGEPVVQGTAAAQPAAQQLAADGDVFVKGAGATVAAAQDAETTGGPVVKGAGGSTAAPQATSGAGGPIAGGTAQTQAASQLTSGAGVVVVAGAAATSNPTQSLSATGEVDVQGSAATAAAAQLLSASGEPIVQGSAATQAAAQTTAADGDVVTNGAAASLAAAQSTSATANVVVQGDGVLSAAPQELSGVQLPVIEGTGATFSAAQLLGASGAVLVEGDAQSAAAAQQLSAAGGTAVQGGATTQQSAQQLSASGGPLVQGTGATVAAAESNTGTVQVIVQAEAATYHAPQQLAADGDVIVKGSAASVAATQQCTSSGAVLTRGSATCASAAQQFAADGDVLAQGQAATAAALQVLAADAEVRITGTCASLAPVQLCSAAGESFFFSTRQLAQSVTDVPYLTSVVSDLS